MFTVSVVGRQLKEWAWKQETRGCLKNPGETELPEQASLAHSNLRDRSKAKAAGDYRSLSPSDSENKTVFCHARALTAQKGLNWLDSTLFTQGKGKSAGHRGVTRLLGMWEGISPIASCPHCLHFPTLLKSSVFLV